MNPDLFFLIPGLCSQKSPHYFYISPNGRKQTDSRTWIIHPMHRLFINFISHFLSNDKQFPVKKPSIIFYFWNKRFYNMFCYSFKSTLSIGKFCMEKHLYEKKVKSS